MGRGKSKSKGPMGGLPGAFHLEMEDADPISSSESPVKPWPKV